MVDLLIRKPKQKLPNHKQAMEQLTEAGYSSHVIADAMLAAGYFAGRSRIFAVAFIQEFQRQLMRRTGRPPAPEVALPEPDRKPVQPLRGTKIDELMRLVEPPKKKYCI